jgi:hypothetical protein
LHHLSGILGVPIRYFFEDNAGQWKSKNKSLDYVSKFLATEDGRALAKAFMRIKNIQVRHRIVKLANAIAGEGLAAPRN